MTYQDYTSAEHRCLSYRTSEFFQAYSRVRHHVMENIATEPFAAFLRGYMESMEQKLAERLNVPEYMLVGHMVDLGMELCPSTDAQDEAEAPELGA